MLDKTLSSKVDILFIKSKPPSLKSRYILRGLPFFSLKKSKNSKKLYLWIDSQTICLPQNLRSIFPTNLKISNFTVTCLNPEIKPTLSLSLLPLVIRFDNGY